MFDSYTCPFCNHTMPLIPSTCYTKEVKFHFPYPDGSFDPLQTDALLVRMYRCPHCEKISSICDYINENDSTLSVPIHPRSSAKCFPKYIPAAIRQDYEEACAIVNLSPKASATLSRRCLQGMIRDFFEIKESNLSKAIGKLEGKIPVPQWKVIDGVRRIGNIGAHMEKDINLIIDIDPDEAQKLIRLIEHLLEQWYINRYEQEQLYTDIIGIDTDKQNQRKAIE